MADRRTLTEGLKATPAQVDPSKEREFVYRNESKSTQSRPTQVSSSPISTRLRADLVAALKRASLERQLQGIEPSTLRDILEEAIEPWLRTQGHIT